MVERMVVWDGRGEIRRWYVAWKSFKGPRVLVSKSARRVERGVVSVGRTRVLLADWILSGVGRKAREEKERGIYKNLQSQH